VVVRGPAGGDQSHRGADSDVVRRISDDATQDDHFRVPIGKRWSSL
jgi:hypothetical protein